MLSEQKDTDFIFDQLKWAWYLKEWNGPEIHERPSAYIVMLLDTLLNEQADIDVGIAAQTILLAATEKDLGGCIIRTVNHFEVRKYFRLEERLKIVMVIALGHPNQEIKLTEIPDSGDVCYFEEKGVHCVPKRELDDIILKPATKS